MSDICHELHKFLNTLPKIRYPFDANEIPKNGIDVFFEKGETGHGTDRVVRIGFHLAEGGLPGRLNQHFESNKNNSVFRQNIGSCFLNESNNPYLDIWRKQMNPKKMREKYGYLVDEELEKILEKQVDEYIRDNFTFCILAVDNREERLRLKSELVSTVSLCNECKPSKNWLGSKSTKAKIIESGLWQENNLYGKQLTMGEIMFLNNYI